MVTPKEVDIAYRYLRGKCELQPRLAVVLGSGIPRPALDVACEVAYDEVPFLAATTVEGHRGAFVFGRAGDVPLVLGDGRLHPYEGIPLDVVTLPIRLFAKLGCSTVILTGAVGSLREEFAPGDVVSLRDHINLLAASPFAGQYYPDFGPRFVAAAGAYDVELRARAKETAATLGWVLGEGVYAAVAGPAFETAAEAQALATLGGDVVGMSVANEVLVARQQGLKVLALGAVVNAAGRAGVSHDDVLTNAQAPGAKIAALLSRLIAATPASW